MRRTRIEVEELTADDVRRMVHEAVMTAAATLREEMQELAEELRRGRAVITHKEAVKYFNGEVTPETILRYIHEEGLPANKNGRLYFIRVQDLFDWQMGRIGKAA